MFNGFWGWFLVAVVVLCIFYANKIPTWVEVAKKYAATAKKVAEQKAKIVQEKIEKNKNKK
jgi:Sec-independent protein translocase protein TatA